MKTALIFILAAITFLSGCLTSSINESFEKVRFAHKVKGVAVLAIEPEDVHFAECVRERLEKNFTDISFMEGKKFKNSFYPWFEPSTIPNTKDEFHAILNKTKVRERINSLDLYLLIYLEKNTVRETMYEKGVVGSGAAGALVVKGVSHDTDIDISVWDLESGDHLGTLNVECKGSAHFGIIVVLPYYIPSRTESTSCRETADRITGWLNECGSAGTK